MYPFCMRKLRNTAISIIVIYLLLLFYSEQLANFLLACLGIAFVPLLILYKILQNKFYKNSIVKVPREFVQNRNTIVNQNCIIKYTPDSKISVMDSMVSRQTRDLRSFSVGAKEVKNINKIWNTICLIFDEQTFFDTIVSIFERENCNVKITLIPSPKRALNNSNKTVVENNINKVKNTESVNLDEVPADKSNITPKQNTPTPKPQIRTPIQPLETKDGFFDLNNLQKTSQDLSKRNEYDGGFIELSSLNSLGNNTVIIDVNSATADQLASLPGLNIVGAKKIVDYRNKEGLFQTVDEFINIAEIKPHFVEQVKKMITISNSRDDNIKNNNLPPQDSDGRIVDL